MAFNGLARDLAWPDLGMDLVEVAAGVFLADRLVSRPRSEATARQIEVKLAVRRRERWRSATPALEEALAVLTGDRFAFRFAQGISSNVAFPSSPAEAPRNMVDRVVLFSGGLDSAVAAAMFAKQNIRSAYVTHYVRGINRTAELLRRIYATYGHGIDMPHAQFYLRPAGTITGRLRENSRRSRSFLFVSLALVTAAALGADEVCVCENGPLALNLPLTAAMVPTRHAHSQFLKAMERFARQLFGTSIRIWNPFELQTKGQLAKIFVSHPELALETVSCWNQQWAGRGRNYGRGHCGFCLPCLVRLVSLEAAGIPFPKRHFDYDVRHHAQLRTLSADDIPRLGPFHALVHFCRTIDECRTWQEFVRTFPLVVDSEPTSATTSGDWFRDVFRTMKRFAGEVGRSLDKD